MVLEYLVKQIQQDYLVGNIEKWIMKNKLKRILKWNRIKI